MRPRVLIVDTYYPEFLKEFYAANPGIAGLSYAEQHRQLMDTGFGVSDAYSYYLGLGGCEAEEVVCNADPTQQAWAREHSIGLTGNVHDQRRQIVAAQVRAIRPHVLYVFEWCPLGDAFLRDMHAEVPLIAGQMASPLPADRTYAGFDLIVSSWPPIVAHFRERGLAADSLRLGFDPRVLTRLIPRAPRFDATFVGGFAPSHPDRVEWLEAVIRRAPVDVFGYGQERIPAESPVRASYRGSVWGRKMYDVLRQSRITLNRHAWIDVAGRVDHTLATNMRLYEATGVGTCLVTDRRSNLGEMFEPEAEVVTYGTNEECAERVQFLLHHADAREAVAQRGQARTLRDHGYDRRMLELADILTRRVSSHGRVAVSS